MASRAAHPELVDSDRAQRALQAVQDKGGEQNTIYTEYIVLTFRDTRQLAPGCDARDLIAWLEENEAEQWAAVGKSP